MTEQVDWDIHTGDLRRHPPVKFSCNLKDGEKPPTHIADELFQQQRFLTLTARVEFWSNNAQMERKVKQAETMAMSYLYKDMLPIVEQILLEADSEEVVSLAGELKAKMRGETQ